jgi:ElaB/YqjD/DUF883 family membrane-anchored ribosome-binding protein
MIDFDEIAEKAKKVAAESSERLNELKDLEDWDQLREVAGSLGEEAAIFVRKYPLQSVLGAAAVGFLLGARLGRRR